MNTGTGKLIWGTRLLAFSYLWTTYLPITSLVLRNHPDVPHKLEPNVSLVSIALIIVEIMIILSPLREGQKWALWAAVIPFLVVGIPRLIADPACQLSDLHHHGCHQFMAAMLLGAIGLILSFLGIFTKRPAPKLTHALTPSGSGDVSYRRRGLPPMSTTQPTASTTSRDLLRHTLATVAYRAGKALQGVPESFAEFKATQDGRTPAQILAHMGDLYDWVLSLCRGKQEWHNSTPLLWPQEVQRFFKALQAVEDYLASDLPLGCPLEKLFQSGIADSLTHVGQINMLRRTAGCPIQRENYFRAEIVAGRLGEQQAAPKRES